MYTCTKCNNAKASWVACNNKGFWAHLCNYCYSSMYPAGQTDIYVAYPRVSDDPKSPYYKP